jgi:hypothetical protein
VRELRPVRHGFLEGHDASTRRDQSFSRDGELTLGGAELGVDELGPAGIGSDAQAATVREKGLVHGSSCGRRAAG